MKRRPILALLALFVLLIPTARLSADAERYWPQWRGPQMNGVSPHGDPPLTWSESDNVRWKVAVPGRGLASPVVWGDLVFVLSADAADAAAYQRNQEAAQKKQENSVWPPSVDPVTQRFLVMAFSRTDGRLVWQQTAIEKTPHETHYIDASWASASPATDGEVVVASFGSNGIFTYDLAGKLLWQTDLGDMQTRSGFGEGSSPTIAGDVVIINWDHEGDSFLAVLDKKTGEERWRSPRPDEITSWATPVVVAHGGRQQIVLPATGHSRGYDLASGEEIWRVPGMTVNVIPSAVERDGVVYLASGYRGNIVQAVSLAKARGDLTNSEAVLWTHDRHTPYVPSLLLYDDKLYFLKHFKNIFTCLDATSGEVVYTEKRLPGISNVYASPVGAAGRIYVFDRDGNAVVLKHGDTYEVLAQNQLDDAIDASPAIVDREIILRSRKYLYSLAAATDKPSEAKTDKPSETKAEVGVSK